MLVLPCQNKVVRWDDALFRMKLQVESLGEQLLLHQVNVVQLRVCCWKRADDVIGLVPNPIWRTDKLMSFDLIGIQNKETQGDVRCDESIRKPMIEVGIGRL